MRILELYEIQTYLLMSYLPKSQFVLKNLERFRRKSLDILIQLQLLSNNELPFFRGTNEKSFESFRSSLTTKLAAFEVPLIGILH